MTDSTQKIINNKNFWIICLSIIILLGFFLRIINLGLDNLFTDEAQSIYYSQYNLKDITKFIYYDNHPPLHFYLLHFWMKCFGTTEFATRCLSVIFGSFSTILMFLLGKEIFNKKVGLAAAFFTAISAFQIAYSQEVRGFILLMFLTTFSLILFWKAIHKNKNIHWLFFIIVASLALYTHHFAWTIIIALNIFIFFSKELKKIRQKWIIIQLMIFLFYIPYFPSLIHSTINLQFGHWTQYFIPSFMSYFDEMLYGFMFLDPGFLNYFSRLLQPVPYFLILILLLNAIFFFKIDQKSELIVKFRKERERFFFLSVIYSIPFIISFITGIHNLRYLIVAFPGFCLLLAKGFTNLKNIEIKIGIILLIIFLSVPSIKATTDKNYQWDKVCNYIEANELDKDLIIIHSFSHFYEFNYYYKGESVVYDLLLLEPSKRNDEKKLEIERIKHNGYSHLINKDNISQLDSITKDFQRVWLVYYDTYLADPFCLVDDYFNKNWQLQHTENFLFGKYIAKVFLYSKVE